MAAAQAFLDEIHEDLPVQVNDHNAYTLGSIGKHHVVIACLPYGEYGIAPATAVATQLLSSFPSIKLGLMVGLGGGVPREEAGIRLGDVVVSKPTSIHGGVIQYDLGKALTGGEFQRTGMLNRPPQILLTAMSKLQANHLIGRKRFVRLLAELEHKLSAQARGTFARPSQEDRLYAADYDHVPTGLSSKPCEACDVDRCVSRADRSDSVPVVHYGLIASADQVVRDSRLRDRLGQELGVYCVEMEAAGLMNNYPCLVIRGVCDYADSHKNKDWQGYAAATAAAYAKELLLVTSVSHVDQIRTVRDTLSSDLLGAAAVPSPRPSRSTTPVAIDHSDLGGVYLGTIRGAEIIPRLIQNPEYWRAEINTLLTQLLAIHPQWWVEARPKTAEMMNAFFARNRLTFRVNIVQRKTPRPNYSGHNRQYLNSLFHHNMGWINGWENAGVPEINMGILNLWAILEFLDRDVE
ncbi:Nucleoside phosphorylase [Aspergillus mulundensis]|uniref:Nucleoside phosphorylase n=1 Tax=Aspergillus mulundensis TaxID=1810919 RepID=A0A3D8RS40_9EURO|nr:Nucleoside phosphorylase [Aspergillus mulundensis]RDW76902.1 Nucleoside phosphorylase [Aspergillus mulundensis]